MSAHDIWFPKAPLPSWIESQLPKIDVANFSVPSISYRLVCGQAYGEIEIAIVQRCNDIHNEGKPVEILFPAGLNSQMLEFMDRAEIARWIFEMITASLRHELAECFKVDGKRIFDPHAEGTKDSFG